MDPRTIGRWTVAELNAAIEGAEAKEWREWRRAAFVAANIMNASGKVKNRMTIDKLLGPMAFSPKERRDAQAEAAGRERRTTAESIAHTQKKANVIWWSNIPEAQRG